MELVFEKFVRKPFVVEAIEITAENIEELAKHIGVYRNRDGYKYINVDRRFIQGVDRVYPGFWMTKMGDNIRCYNRKIFLDQFTPSTVEAETWVHYFNEPKAEEPT